MRFQHLFIALCLFSGISISQANDGKVKDLSHRLKWVNTVSLSLAIEDFSKDPSYNSTNALSSLAFIEENLSQTKSSLSLVSVDSSAVKLASQILEEQKKILLSNPAMDMDKIVITRFGLGDDSRKAMANKMCMPFSNYMGLIDVPASGYDAELIELSSLKSTTPKLRSIYKPTHGEGIADVQMHWDGDRMLFASCKPVVLDGFYNQEYPAWHIFEIGLDGENLTHMTNFPEPDLEFADPCYLPDGRILFTTNIGYNGIPCEHGERVIMNLAIYNPVTKKMRKLTFDQDGNWSPSVMQNGRIMYTRWEYTDLTHYFTRIVMHSNPDGSNCKALYGSGSYWPTSVYDMQQLPTPGNKFIGVVSGHHGVPRSGKLIIFDPAKGHQEADGVVQEIPFRNRKVEPIIKDRLVDGVYPQFSRPFPLNEKYFLVTSKLHSQGLWGVYLVDVYDNMTLLYEKEGEGFLTPIPVIKRPTPPIVPDLVDEEKEDATIFIQDIYEGEGLRGVPRGTVKKLRLFTYEYAYLKSPSDFDALGIQSGWDLKRELGEVPLEEDGSAMFKVPANTPISIQPLDEHGHAIQWMRSWFTAMPGEVLSCIGCHEDPNKIPIPKRVQASKKSPVEIETPEGGVRPFSFELEIQPILTKYCISCHNGDDNEIDLTGKTKTEYKRWGNYTTHRYINDSYYALHPYVYRQGPEADIKVLEPYEYHSSNSELIQMLQQGHHEVEVQSEDMKVLAKWIDFNAPYFGDFEIAGRYKATFEQYPRRQQLMQKYANVSTDWKGELARYAEFLENKGEIKTIVPRKKRKKSPSKPLKGNVFSVEKAKRMQLEDKGTYRKTVEVTPGLSIDFVWIPPGKGSQEKGFWMSVTEITNAQFQALYPDHDSRYIGQQWKDHTTPGYPVNGKNQPVIRVSWQQAVEYCEKVSQLTGLSINLPSEKQWEWACLAGSNSDMWYGDKDADYSSFENLADFTIKDLAVYGLEPTVPMPDDFFCREFWDFVPRDRFANDQVLVSANVAQYQANPWGLYDMHGNVAEWTISSVNKDGVFKDQKVVCGGSWRDRAKNATAKSRRFYQSWQRAFNVGFRLIIQ